MSWPEEFPITPQTPEDQKECETPDGIRRWLRKIYYHHRDPLVRQCFQIAEHRGMSGEDLYTVMAFEALKAMDRYKRMCLDYANLMPAPTILKVMQSQSPSDHLSK